MNRPLFLGGSFIASLCRPCRGDGGRRVRCRSCKHCGRADREPSQREFRLSCSSGSIIGQSPSALQQLKHQEHEEIKGKRNKDEYYLSSEDYKKMDFTQNVINEALRFGNIVKFVHRKALKDVTFQGHLIPVGWKVLPVFSAAHLDSSLHDNALEFHPWRWEELSVVWKNSQE